MHMAIIDPDPVASHALSFAAQRRGHQVICFPSPDRLSSNLPFEPSVVLVALRPEQEDTRASLDRIKAAMPLAAVLATVERPKGNALLSVLENGATDVATAPYNPHALVLKAEKWHSVLAKATQCESGLQAADLEVDLNRYFAVKNGVPLNLTKLELRLLYCLLEHHPNLAPLERLLSFGWDILSTPESSLIKTHMSHLRRKLADAGGVPFRIQSRQTIGYIISWSD
jgi:DNA-binding response OmpR family regulator